MNTSNLQHGQAGRARILGAIVASVCVMGLVGMIWLHAEHPAVQLGTAVYVAPAATPTDTAFLHAPAAFAAVPSADQVFSRRDASTDDAPAAPTF
jgi:hypothetical protein